MNHPEKLKAHAVVTTEKYGLRRRAASANQAHRGIIPRRIHDLTCRHLPVRNFARRKDRKHSALLQPCQRLPQGPTVRFHRAVRVKGIYEDAMFSQFGHIAQQKIRQHLHIRADTRQQDGEDRTIQHAIGMVRNYDDWTVRRNPRLIRSIHGETDFHLGEQALEAESLGRFLHSVV